MFLKVATEVNHSIIIGIGGLRGAVLQACGSVSDV